MKYDFNEVHNRLGTYCTQWDYIQDRFNKKDASAWADGHPE